jgi:hypothetical protein
MSEIVEMRAADIVSENSKRRCAEIWARCG